MTRLLVRVFLLLLSLASIGAAAFHTWQSTQSATADALALRQFEDRARGVVTAIADLRGAESSYVAAGQGADFWIARVDALRTELESTLPILRASARTAEAISPLDSAAAALQDFAQMDLRARDQARNGQLAQASNMIFADGFELTKKAGDAVERALVAEQTGHDAAAGAARREQGTVLAAAGGIGALALLLLTPSGRREPDPVPISIVAPIPNDLDLAPIARPVKAPPASPNIEVVASLCGDLARIPDSQSLPALLERTAAVLQATGIVLWIADPDGRELVPIVVHGYSPQLASRLGTIPRDAENVTAAAYRTGLLQMMKGDAISSGALAVPLVAANGCVGVMAAEVKDGGEQQAPLQAAATIIAAQLATLVGPPSARSRAEAAG
jgi:hypothetical protein